MHRLTALPLALVLACGDIDPVAPDAGANNDATTPAAAVLCITELMASNAFTVEDDTGVRADWIELFNPGDDAVDLAGYSITDDLAEPRKHVFAAGVSIPAGGYLVLWADAAPELGPEHLRIGLDKDGEAVGLYGPGGEAIAAVEYGAQVTDWSVARVDGRWEADRDPTPGEQNPGAAPQDCGPDPESAPDVPDPSPELYDEDVVIEIGITLSPAALAALESDPFEYVEGAVTYRGRTYEPVGIRLKGQSSFLPISEKASFKIKFNEYVQGAEFFEIKKLTLNNMRSDATMMHERLSYRVFREAGVPASRCNHARLSLNGEYYGLYANVENVDDIMVARWFEDPAGPLFEGHDIEFAPEYVALFEHEDGPDDRTNIMGVAEALLLEPAAVAIAAADEHADIAQYRSFWAVSAAVGQFDGYPYHWDDFHVYDDPVDGRLQFIPWGTDESFDPTINLLWVNGLLSTRCGQVQECIIDWAYEVLDHVDLMEQMDILGAVDEVAAQIQPYVQMDPRRPYGPLQIAAAREQMRKFIAERRETILEQFSPDPEPE